MNLTPCSQYLPGGGRSLVVPPPWPTVFVPSCIQIISVARTYTPVVQCRRDKTTIERDAEEAQVHAVLAGERDRHPLCEHLAMEPGRVRALAPGRAGSDLRSAQVPTWGSPGESARTEGKQEAEVKCGRTDNQTRS